MTIFAEIDEFFSQKFDPRGVKNLGMTKERLQNLVATNPPQACYCTFYRIVKEKIRKNDGKVKMLVKRKINVVIESCHKLDRAILSGLKLNRPYNRYEAGIIWFAMALKFLKKD